MKKLFFASVFALAALTSCQNETLNDVNPSKTENVKNNSKTNARGTEIKSLEDALELSKNENVVIVNPETLRAIYEGEILQETGFDNNIVTNPLERRIVKTICSIKEGGITYSIAHVYDNHYSGYQLITSNGHMSVSSEIFGGPLNCPALWLSQFP